MVVDPVHVVQGLAPELFGFVRVLADEDRCGDFLRAALEGAWIGNGDVAGRICAGDAGDAREALRLAAFRQAFLLVRRDAGEDAPRPDGPLGVLDGEERAVLYLRRHTDFTLDEAADIVDLDRARVFSLLHGARGKLGAAPWAGPGPRGAGRGEGCVHASQAVALVDADAADEESLRPLLRHVQACEPCGRLRGEAARAADAAADLVPRLRIPRPLQARLEREILRFVGGGARAGRPAGVWGRAAGALRALLGRRPPDGPGPPG